MMYDEMSKAGIWCDFDVMDTIRIDGGVLAKNSRHARGVESRYHDWKNNGFQRE
jgi:hypothetical protein